MLFDHFVPLLSALVGVAGFFYVARQFRISQRQRESESLVKLYDINRELLSLAISHPVLLEILEDRECSNSLLKKRYLQMWLNQLSITFEFLQRTVIDSELKQSLLLNIEDFFSANNLREHWREYGLFYPLSFQIHVNHILKKVEPPEAAQLTSSL